MVGIRPRGRLSCNVELATGNLARVSVEVGARNYVMVKNDNWRTLFL